MIRSIIAVVILGVLCCYLFYLNPGTVTVNVSASRAIQAPMAIVLIVVFFLGALLVGLLSAIISAFHSFDDWKRDRKYRRETQHREQIVQARDALVTDNLPTAQSILERIVAREPENALAWLSLAETTERMSGAQAALAVLDRARLNVPRNAELLFRTAAISESIGNLTGSFDNLQLILREHPGNTRTLRALLDCSKKLGRYDVAIASARELLKRVHGASQDRLHNEIADCELAQVERTDSNDGADAKRNAIEDVIRRHRDHVPSLAALAQLEQARGDVPETSRLLARCFSLTGNIRFLETIAEIWLGASNPAKAMQSVTGAVNSLKQDHPYFESGQLALAALCIKLGMLEEASTHISKISAFGENHARAEIIKGLIAVRKQQFAIAVEHFSTALVDELSAKEPGEEPSNEQRLIIELCSSAAELPSRLRKPATGEAPSPELSTP